MSGRARAARLLLACCGGSALWYALGARGGLALAGLVPPGRAVVPLPEQGAAAARSSRSALFAGSGADRLGAAAAGGRWRAVSLAAAARSRRGAAAPLGWRRELPARGARTAASAGLRARPLALARPRWRSLLVGIVWPRCRSWCLRGRLAPRAGRLASWPCSLVGDLAARERASTRR